MTNTYQTKTVRQEENEIIVFFEFSNGELNSAHFPLTANITDIIAWADARAKWFDDREIELAREIQNIAEQLVE